MRHLLLGALAIGTAIACAACMPARAGAPPPSGGASGGAPGGGKDSGAGAAAAEGKVRFGAIAVGAEAANAADDGVKAPDVPADKAPPNKNVEPTKPEEKGDGSSASKPKGGPPGGGGGGGGKTGAVHAAVVDSSTGLSEADIRTTIAKKSGSFQACYSIGVASAADFAGAVTVRAAIGPTGVVASIEVTSSTTKNARVDGCVVDALRVIQFPATGSGGTASIPVEFGR